MLVWVAALHCEAKPVIDFYRLKKSPQGTTFEFYHGDNMACIISGIGKIASAAATAWMAAKFADEAVLSWINLGTAGAAKHDIGAAFMLNQIVDADSGQRYYPAPGAGSRLNGSAGLTLGRPSEDYQENYLFDLEASGFIGAALRFSSAELIQSIKIVSDNRKHKVGKNKAQISALIHQQLDSIEQLAHCLLELDHELAALEASPESWRRLIAMAHFSQTQKHRLRVLWRYLNNTEQQEQYLLQQLEGEASAAQIIRRLEQLSFEHSSNL